MADMTITPLMRLLLEVPSNVGSGWTYNFSSRLVLSGLSYDSTLTGYSATVEKQIQADGTTDSTPVPATIPFSPGFNSSIVPGATVLLGEVVMPTLDATTTAVVLNIRVPIDFTFESGAQSSGLTIDHADVISNPTGAGYTATINFVSSEYVVTPQSATVNAQSNYPPPANAQAGSTTAPADRYNPGKRDVTVSVPITVTPSSPTPTSPTYLGLLFSLPMLFMPVPSPEPAVA